MRHFEPNPLLGVPQQDKDPQELVCQQPVHRAGNPNAVQDPFGTQMEVPFTEDVVKPVFKRPEMADFEIPPVLEEMIPDGSLIDKNLPKQAQINRKYLRKMHLPCSLRDMQAAYVQIPHFCDIYNAIMFNSTPNIEKQLKSCNKQCLVSMWFKEDCCIYT